MLWRTTYVTEWGEVNNAEAVKAGFVDTMRQQQGNQKATNTPK